MSITDKVVLLSFRYFNAVLSTSTHYGRQTVTFLKNKNSENTPK